MQEMKENEQDIEHIENKKASRFGEKLFSKQKPNTIIKKKCIKKKNPIQSLLRTKLCIPKKNTTQSLILILKYVFKQKLFK